MRCPIIQFFKKTDFEKFADIRKKVTTKDPFRTYTRDLKISNFDFNLFSVVVGAVHEMVFPPICYLSKKEDRELLACTEYLQHKTNFGADQLGLSEDFCIPLPAAVVELASLDQRTTPLDREFYLDQILTFCIFLISNFLKIEFFPKIYYLK